MSLAAESGKQPVHEVTLTNREAEILDLVMQGKSSKEVGVALHCSPRTVEYYLDRIYKKLNVSNRVEAVRQAAHLGLVDIRAI